MGLINESFKGNTCRYHLLFFYFLSASTEYDTVQSSWMEISLGIPNNDISMFRVFCEDPTTNKFWSIKASEILLWNIKCSFAFQHPIVNSLKNSIQ